MNLKSAARTFLVTGASRGIGAATALALASQGHEVVGLARTRPVPFCGAFVEADLSDRAALKETLETIARDYRIDGVVNCAGVVSAGFAQEVTPEELDRVYDMNVRVGMQVAQAFLPAMRESGFGRVVNISSIVAAGRPGRTAYAASKAAVEAMTRTWARELASEGVTVNAVAPGPVETELFRQNNPPGSAGEAAFLSMIPMGRLGRPEEIAALIAFLCTDEAGFITGQVIACDGGATAGLG
jgi:3-oxoacyl-[acyl-carrier protein] reductase